MEVKLESVDDYLLEEISDVSSTVNVDYVIKLDKEEENGIQVRVKYIEHIWSDWSDPIYLEERSGSHKSIKSRNFLTFHTFFNHVRRF